MVQSIYTRISGVGIVCGLLLLALVVMAPAAARGDTIADIEPGDTVFVYEEGLDLSGLRNETTDNPVTALYRYNEGDPNKGLLQDISVPDDTDFALDDVDVGVDTGLYHAYSSGDNARTGKWIFIEYPEIRIEPVLAAPNHADRIEGITIPTGTAIAFRVTSAKVGTRYVAGDEYASVDIVITTPGGAELMAFKGRDLSDIPIISKQFYTDDPGMPGPIVLDRLEEGEYKVQAKWHSPQGFADSAEDSNIVTFYSDERIGVNTTVTTPTVTTTTVTETPTTVATTASPTETTVETTASETTIPETTTTAPATTPTQTPLTLIPVFVALALGVLAMTRK